MPDTEYYNELSIEEMLWNNVQRGAKLLDEKKPGWFNQINLDELEISECEYCVLGQLYGSYDRGLLDILETDGQYSYFKRMKHGFTGSDSDFPVLDRLWKDEIRNRRKLKENQDE